MIGLNSLIPASGSLALDTLHTICKDQQGSPSDRISAASKILDTAIKHCIASDQEERLQRLEEAVKQPTT